MFLILGLCCVSLRRYSDFFTENTIMIRFTRALMVVCSSLKAHYDLYHDDAVVALPRRSLSSLSSRAANHGLSGGRACIPTKCQDDIGKY